MHAPHEQGNKSWWTEKYQQSSNYLYGKNPSAFLAENITLLTPGETLDIAMGEGRNSVFLAMKGFTVTGVDFVDLAVDRAKSLAKNCGITIDSKAQDLNFFLIPLMKYSTMVVTDFKPPITMLKSLSRGLAPKGTLLIEAYTMDQIQRGQGFKPEPFECFKANELISHVRDLHIIYYNEREMANGEYRVQLIAKKN